MNEFEIDFMFMQGTTFDAISECCLEQRVSSGG